jgi:hypothetical protein
MIPSLQGCKVTGFTVFHFIAKGYIFINRVIRVSAKPSCISSFHHSNDEVQSGNDEHRTEEISQNDAELLTGFSSFAYLAFYPTKVTEGIF